MKQFKSLLEAIFFHTLCPLCQKKMEINDRDLAVEYGYDEGCDSARRLSFYLNQREDDIVTVDIVSGLVEIQLRERTPPMPNAAQLAGLAPLPQSIIQVISGKFIHGLTVDCKSCCQYSYTIQIHFDLTNKNVSGVFLNSESVSIEEGDMVHEIKNVYAVEQTEYACFPRDGSSKRSCIPLIPLDMNHPKETVSRIRKLLIFS